MANVSRVVGGGLFALFCTLVIAALSFFGAIPETLGHLCMFFAWVVGGILISTEIIPGRPVRHKVWVISGFAVIMLGADISIAHLRPGLAPPLMPISVSFDGCHFATLPLSIEGQSTLYWIPLNPKRFQTIRSGFLEVTNTDTKEIQWPSKAAMESVTKNFLDQKRHYWGDWFQRCEISNRGRVNLTNAAIFIKFWFGEKGGEENAETYTVQSGPIDVGGQFIFYIGNVCPGEVSGVVQDTARTESADDNEVRQMPLNMPHRNALDQILFFPASSSNWLGDACE